MSFKHRHVSVCDGHPSQGTIGRQKIDKVRENYACGEHYAMRDILIVPPAALDEVTLRNARPQNTVTDNRHVQGTPIQLAFVKMW